MGSEYDELEAVSFSYSVLLMVPYPKARVSVDVHCVLYLEPDSPGLSTRLLLLVFRGEDFCLSRVSEVYVSSPKICRYL